MRALYEINVEYNQLCQKMGDLMIQRETLTKEMNSVMVRIGQLQDEAQARQLFESEKAKEAKKKEQLEKGEEKTEEPAPQQDQVPGT